MIESLKLIFSRKKKLLHIYLLLLVLYGLIKLVNYKFKSLEVLEFAYITLIFGLAPAYYLKRVFKFQNIISWFTNACALSFVLIPFLFLFFGWWKIDFVFVHSIRFLYLSSLAGLLLLFFSPIDLSDNQYHHFKNISLVDFFFYAIIFTISFLLTLRSVERVWPRWDAFTYWALDAKLIFDLNQLRGTQFDVFNHFKDMSSYYPILISIVYDLYGYIIEQLATWINIFMHFLALLLIYNRAVGKPALQRFFVVALLLIVSYLADPTAFLFSMYAEIISAFLLLLFVVILHDSHDLDHKTYTLRLLLLVLIASSFYFIKNKYLFLTLGLIFLILVYDIQFILKNVKKIIRTPYLYITLLLVLTIWLSFLNFKTNRLAIERSPSDIVTFFVSKEKPLSDFITYTRELVKWLWENTPYLLGLWLLSMISVFIAKEPLKNKPYSYTFILIGGLYFMHIAAYVNRLSSLTSGSLARYTSLVMYLIPLLFTVIFVKKLPKLLHYTLYVLLSIVTIFIFNKLITPPIKIWNLREKTYEAFFSEYSSLAKKVIAITGDRSRIIIADDYPPNYNRIRNQDPPALYIRYFLMYNSVGGQYRTTMSGFSELVTAKQAEYILLLSYDNSFKNCEQLLTEGHDYLIEIDYETFGKAEGCVFSDYPIIDLTDN